MSEIWNKIVQHQKEIRRQRARDFEPVKFVKRETAVEKRRREEREKLNMAIGIVTSILEDIRENSKEIREAHFNTIYTGGREMPGYLGFLDGNTYVCLEWGNKYMPTEEEWRILKEYKFADATKQKQGNNLPESFIGEDYYHIGTSIRGISPREFLTGSDLPIALLAEQLINPSHHFREYIKGRDYWRPPFSEQWEPPIDIYHQQ